MSKETDLIKEIKDAAQDARDATDADFEEALADLNFINGDQWDEKIRNDRQTDGRPCLTIDKLSVHCDSVIGDIRQNEPKLKIKPVDSKADPKTARILTGLIRNIEVQSDAEVAYDTAGEACVHCGFGAWRIVTEYADDDAFEQDIRIKRVKNPFTILWDPGSQLWDRSDSDYCLITEKVSRAKFIRLYPKAAVQSFDMSKDRDFFWGDDKSVRLAEYWKREAVKKTLYLVQGTPKVMGAKPTPVMVTESKPDPNRLAADPNFTWNVLRERKVDSHKLIWYKTNGAEILEGPTDWPGRYFPIIMMYGKETIVEGHSYFRGVVRKAKDAQRLYNYSRSTSAEVISLAPKSPYLVTAAMIGEYQDLWKNAHKRNFPYLPYNFDTSNPAAMPKRAEPVAMNTGIQNEVMLSDQEIHDTTGQQQASLGQKSNEKSGRAILARQREGDIANFPFYDNLARAMRYQGKVLVDLIPKVYDTPRILRILNEDGSEKMVQVNAPFQEQGPNGEAINQLYDLTVGKYDCVVSIGPSYTTEREEAADSMMEFMKVAGPAIIPLIGDLVVKNMDWPGADEMEKRLKMLLPPQLQQQGGAGVPPPPPTPPDPRLVMEVKNLEEEAKGKAIENEIAFLKLQRLKQGLPAEPSDPEQHQLEREKMQNANMMDERKQNMAAKMATEKNRMAAKAKKNAPADKKPKD